MKVYIKKKKIDEDVNASQENVQQSEQNNNVNTDTSTDTAIKLQNDFNQIQTAYNNLLKEFNVKKAAFNDQVQKLNQLAASEHIKLSFTLSESASYMQSFIDMRFKKKLYEARNVNSEVEELIYLFKIAIERVGEISKTATIKNLKTYARNVKTYISDSGWHKEITPKNHWDELAAFIKDKLKNGEHLKLYDSEADKVIENLKELFKISSTFSWILGNEKDKK